MPLLNQKRSCDSLSRCFLNGYSGSFRESNLIGKSTRQQSTQKMRMHILLLPVPQ